MGSKCFEKYGKEWSDEQNRRTVEFFEGYDKQHYAVWEIEVKHITGTPECIAVVGDHMKTWVEQALTNYIFNSENQPSDLEQLWINHDVNVLGAGFQIYLFNYSSFFPFFGVKVRYFTRHIEQWMNS